MLIDQGMIEASSSSRRGVRLRHGLSQLGRFVRGGSVWWVLLLLPGICLLQTLATPCPDKLRRSVAPLPRRRLGAFPADGTHFYRGAISPSKIVPNCSRSRCCRAPLVLPTRPGSGSAHANRRSPPQPDTKIRTLLDAALHIDGPAVPVPAEFISAAAQTGWTPGLTFVTSWKRTLLLCVKPPRQQHVVWRCGKCASSRAPKTFSSRQTFLLQDQISSPKSRLLRLGQLPGQPVLNA